MNNTMNAPGCSRLLIKLRKATRTFDGTVIITPMGVALCKSDETLSHNIRGVVARLFPPDPDIGIPLGLWAEMNMLIPCLMEAVKEYGGILRICADDVYLDYKTKGELWFGAVAVSKELFPEEVCDD